eukprot:CAMPEP_0172034744 /NCGR_PEP_ID=MMETSP1041-20130122/21188_1 /TAXON_ID=464988 /ORGANISM="Hemiselmis andersenii, Strain CCMP439" /LENGTH=62 /DNA_ID=CAMNT_0012691715 /DNA_START=219 /DNA_END=404 /DNA_ORIENTATION=+
MGLVLLPPLERQLLLQTFPNCTDTTHPAAASPSTVPIRHNPAFPRPKPEHQGKNGGETAADG